MAVNTTSSQLRQKGNEFYSSVTNDLSPCIKISRLEKAIYYYDQALNAACNEEDKCSALKNYGMVNWKMAKNVEKSNNKAIKSAFYFKQAIEKFSDSHVIGCGCKSTDWNDNLIQSLYNCVQDAMDDIGEVGFQEKVATLEQYVYLNKVKSVRADYCVELAKIYFAEALSCYQKGEIRRCLYYLSECYRPVEEARSAGSTHEIEVEVRVMNEDIYLQSCVAESVQARETGDKLLTDVLREEENLKVDMIWEIIDWYKQAVILTREKDVEMEAIALSRVGRVYDKVLKLKYKASENYKRAIQLALSLHPRTFTQEDWFKECQSTLERYQKEIVEHESDKWNRERAQFIDQLKDELKTLSETSLKSNEEFLRFIYDKFPPKNANHTLKDIPNTNDEAFDFKINKLLKTAIIHFHPDRQKVETDGKKWKVMCEEITKQLTSKYESYKIPPEFEDENQNEENPEEQQPKKQKKNSPRSRSLKSSSLKSTSMKRSNTQKVVDLAA